MTTSEIIALVVGGAIGFRLVLVLGARKRLPQRRTPPRPRVTVRIRQGSEWVVTADEFARLRSQGLL